MDRDSFSDPRRRSTRLRGGRGRGRGASRGSRGAARGRGAHGGGTKRPGVSRQKAEELGSNAYRFREPEENEDEDEFEVGIDIEEAAAGSMTDNAYADAYKLDDDVISEMFSVNLEGMEKALQSVPLWVRLGDVSRFALGVADDDVIENYLDPFEEEEVSNGNESRDGVGAELSEALAGLNFDDDEEEHAGAAWEVPNTENRVNVESAPDRVPSSVDVGNKKPSGKATDVNSSAGIRDDFDEWLDDV